MTLDLRGRRQRLVAAVLIVGLLVGAGWVPLAGCSRRGARGPVADTLGNGLPRVLGLQLEPWLECWRKAAPQFALDSLRSSGTAPFTFDGMGTGAGSYVEDVRSRAGILVASPDSTHALDFDSYLDFDRGPDGGILIEREPDSRPILFDFKSDTLWQVEFCGTSCFHDGGYWLDAQRFALTGATQTGEQADGPWCAFLEIYDLRTRLSRRWLAPTVDEAGIAVYQAAAEAALAARLERAGFPGQAGATSERESGSPAH